MNYEDFFELDQGLDRLFLGDLSCIEEKIQGDDPSLYRGLSIQALMTCYYDYYQMLIDLNKNDILIDLGSSYSRGSFLSNALSLNTCHGVELSSERVNYAKERIKTYPGPSDIYHLDLLSGEIPFGDAYYLYFPKGIVFNRILSTLISYSNKRSLYLYVCEAHGDVFDYLDLFSDIFILKKTFECSLERHADQIRKYKISNEFEFSDKSEFKYWYLMNYMSDAVIVINTYDLISQTQMDWYIQIKYFELIIYQKKIALQHYTKNRIIDISSSEPIKEIKKFSECSVQIKEELEKNILGFKMAPK